MEIFNEKYREKNNRNTRIIEAFTKIFNIKSKKFQIYIKNENNKTNINFYQWIEKFYMFLFKNTDNTEKYKLLRFLTHTYEVTGDGFIKEKEKYNTINNNNNNNNNNNKIVLPPELEKINITYKKYQKAEEEKEQQKKEKEEKKESIYEDPAQFVLSNEQIQNINNAQRESQKHTNSGLTVSSGGSKNRNRNRTKTRRSS
jgi:hypothetical protein